MNTKVNPPQSGLRAAVRDWVENPRVQNCIMALIVINAIVLGLETVPSVMQNYGVILLAADSVILGVFVVEILLRLFAHRLAFFRDPWSLFDFVVVGIALVPASGPLAVLRALRILRVLRLLTLVPSMRRVVGALMGSIPGLSSIGLVLLLIYYVFAVIATKLFGANFPQWFGTIGESLVLAVPDHDPGKLVDGHRAPGHGGSPQCMDILCHIYPHRDLHHVEPVHRHNRQRDAQLHRGRKPGNASCAQRSP